MPSLLDTVKQNSAALSAPSTSPATNPLLAATGAQPTTGESTEATAALTGLGQTGKLQPTGGMNTRLSSLGEKLASLQTLNQNKQLTQQAQLQGISLDQQADTLQQQYRQNTAQIDEQRVTMTQQFNQQLNGMLFEQSSQLKTLDLNKDKSRMEQMGFMLRLGNQQYIDQLTTEGQKARLDNAVSFNEALQRSVFSDETDLLSSSLEFRNYLQADQRQSEKILAGMDIDFALQVASTENKAASAGMMWSGIGNLAGAGAAAGASYLGQPGSIVGEEASTAVPVQAGAGQASITNPFPEFNAPTAPAYEAPGGGTATGIVPATPFAPPGG